MHCAQTQTVYYQIYMTKIGSYISDTKLLLEITIHINVIVSPSTFKEYRVAAGMHILHENVTITATLRRTKKSPLF